MKIQDLLKDRFLYLNVPNLKEMEAKFFLGKMKNRFQDVDIFYKKEGFATKTVTGNDINEAARDVSFYVSAFFSVVMSFFDSLAIFHTKERQRVYDKIHFDSWLNYQFKHNRDGYIEFLYEQKKEWIDDFRKNRNDFIHKIHTFAAMDRQMHVRFGRGSEGLIRKYFVTDLREGKKELLPYCEEIYNRIVKLEDKINENIDKEYSFDLGGRKLQQSARLQKTQDGRVLGACLFIPAHILPDLPPDVDSLDFVIEGSGNRLVIRMRSNFSKE